MSFNPTIKIYQGYGNPNKFFIIGHVFNNYSSVDFNKRNHIWNNFKTLYSLFNVDTLANIELCLEWNDNSYFSVSEFDGFFKFEIDIESIDLELCGWQEFTIKIMNKPNIPAQKYSGQMFIPVDNSMSIISDIDDTIVKSYSTKTYKKLMELMSKNANQRTTFDYISEFLNTFRQHPTGTIYNYFYVSSSEWNLYDYIKHVFNKNRIPDGILLLNSIKSLKEFYKTGYSGHEGKFFRIARLFISFPHMKFLLIGDNSQRDVHIYSAIAQKYPEQILGIFIRNVRKSKMVPTDHVLKELEILGIRSHQFTDSKEMIDKCKEWELM